MILSTLDYYQLSRTHLSLDKDAPDPRDVQPPALGEVVELPKVGGLHHRYNDRAEVSHQPTRQRERQMGGFKSAGQAQRFLSAHGVIQNLFRVGRHLVNSANRQTLRDRSFCAWRQVTGTC